MVVDKDRLVEEAKKFSEFLDRAFKQDTWTEYYKGQLQGAVMFMSQVITLLSRTDPPELQPSSDD